jgi:hypothetical protein
VLLSGCETQLVTNEEEIQMFINRCLRSILKIWWPRTISKREPWQLSGQRDINIEKRKRKFRWIGHTLSRNDEQPSKVVLQQNAQGSRGRWRPRNSWRTSTLERSSDVLEIIILVDYCLYYMNQTEG